jgi:hypothetical protein
VHLDQNSCLALFIYNSYHTEKYNSNNQALNSLNNSLSKVELEHIIYTYLIPLFIYPIQNSVLIEIDLIWNSKTAY